ncbi:phosphomannomutase CpsG [Amphritea balenae]|uniref:phosphomannomutase n=1 Tax=Amphritea balenae TaxID=452629 RepID=A0A3P1SUD6_9GAMM|nr:phosphomannomutase CpsG [Amphritea balenae]RRD00166.1 phosphomannomutase CpsG [Amphritea balenae]GGK77216.1 phosphomannomutase [Amphritea balenae]
MSKLACFKAYDIRGQLGTQLDEDLSYRIGRAYAEFLQPKTVVVGGDMRLSTESLKQALANGLRDAGVDVLDIGLCGTEEIYFATAHLDMDGGIVVTASHNPEDYNGMKLVRKGSRPISGDTGLNDIEQLARENNFAGVDPSQRGSYNKADTLTAYVEHLKGYVKLNTLKPLKLVVNAGNGVAGHVIDALEQQFDDAAVPVEFIKIHHQPDGTFPNGIPNPILEENRADTIAAVLEHKADMGIAWDGDFDRCFLFDENGRFIEGYYIVGLLAEAFLAKNPGAAIIHDPRLTWNTLDIVKKAGGNAVQCKTGHAFIKERMREENAVYGGEMSAHHYFRDFFYCDSGMVPWLLVAELICNKSKTLSQLVDDRITQYPSPGEINSKLEDPKASIAKVLNTYQANALGIDYTDGISLDMGEWRFNLRSSNTEPVVRLNVETRGNEALMKEKTDELLQLLRG